MALIWHWEIPCNGKIICGVVQYHLWLLEGKWKVLGSFEVRFPSTWWAVSGLLRRFRSTARWLDNHSIYTRRTITLRCYEKSAVHTTHSSRCCECFHLSLLNIQPLRTICWSDLEGLVLEDARQETWGAELAGNWPIRRSNVPPRELRKANTYCGYKPTETYLWGPLLYIRKSLFHRKPRINP